MKGKIEQRKQWIKIAAIILGVGAVLLCYAGFVSRPQNFAAQEVTCGDLTESIDVSGKVHGEDKKTYYATVTAPISQIDVEAGNSVSANALIVAYDTSDLEKKNEEALLQAQASESGVKAEVTKSNQNAARYAKATAEEQLYQYLYAAWRNDSNGLTQQQYVEEYYRNCQSDSIQKSIAEKSQQAAQKNERLAQIEDKESEEYKKLMQEVADLNVSITGLQKDAANLPNAAMTPEEKAHATYNADLMEDIARNWTQSTTTANTYENQIMNQYQKDTLEKKHEIVALSVSTTEEDLRNAAAGVQSEFEGIITEVLAKEGAVVTKGTPLFTVESTDDMKVEVEISKYDIGKVQIGQKADIQIAGKKFSGTVADIKRLAQDDSSDKAKVKADVKIDQPNDSIILGIESDVVIYTAEKESTIIMPATALYSDDLGDYCYAIENGIVVRKDLETGISTNEYVEIISGLKTGDRVITDAVTNDQLGKKAVTK
ncbi:MAG: efflux RND transporter periplasmic adaptor subunit [Clostridia bacterium]|nr:efflux RND transporter periplasmic adaptor subunit [Clostridia bacterium]